MDELAVGGLTEAAALWQSFEASWPNCFTILADGEPCAMFGVTETQTVGHGIPWMLGSDRMLQIPRDLMVQGLYWIDHLNNLFPFLQNFVSEENLVSIRWLEKMRFVFHEAHDVNGTTFRRFTRCANPSPSPLS